MPSFGSVANSEEMNEVIKRIRVSAEDDTAVTVRHEWPPNWTSPKGKWVLIQPWEYGALPSDWPEHIKKVDEVWVPTSFVKNEYIYSGVPQSKVKVVPNGYDPEKFNLKVIPAKLATSKKFKFIFLGGTIYRKGPDILLESYLKAFTSKDDVCLVIKDFGGKGPYAGQTYKEEIESAMKDLSAPEILYLDEEMTTDEIASLYRACDCFVLPYRGEGFALPVLEAMASGLPVIVTSGGATDDFVKLETGWCIPSKTVSIGKRIGSTDLVKEGWILEPNPKALEELLKWAAAHPEEAKKKGLFAAEDAKKWTWENAANIAFERIVELSNR